VKKGEGKANLETIRLLEEQYYADHREYVAAADTAALKAALPGFEPGNTAALYYSYSVACGAGNQTFTATATPGSNAPPGSLTIDQSNNKTGW
jgi:Tfp pilus assembly protein PilE